jgi:hypothetical protein
MPTKKDSTKKPRTNKYAQPAAKIAAFANDPNVPEVFQSAIWMLFAHAMNATGIQIVGGKDCNEISQTRLAQFIKRAETLGYDEGGLFDNHDGEYLIKREAQDDKPDSIEAFSHHLSEALRIARSSE